MLKMNLSIGRDFPAKRFFLFIIGVVFICTTGQGGTIIGNVHAEGKTGAEANAAEGPYSSRKYKFVERVDYTAMHEFVVYIEGVFVITNGLPTNIIQVVTKRVAQQGAMFTPHLLPIMAGSTVQWPNHDEIFHNVFSMSEAKQFDLGLYKGDPPEKSVTFDKPGRVDVFCSIHERMHCIVLVLENPCFAVTDAKGNYKIADVPPGSYKLRTWHERLPAALREITVPANGEMKVDFVLGIKNLPQY
jgi:plastocyanin